VWLSDDNDADGYYEFDVTGDRGTTASLVLRRSREGLE
jgi:hypothetical protein